MAYSDVERAEAIVRLAVNQYDFEKTAEQTGVSIRSLRGWAKNSPKKGIPELLERAIERMLMVIPKNMTGNEWAIALGILMDKWLLMRGQATVRTESVSRQISELNNDDYAEVIAEAERILAETAGSSIGVGP
ncbi:MAG: hypothetical protein ABIH03_16665 [Pseudomonadota bacterium]